MKNVMLKFKLFIFCAFIALIGKTAYSQNDEVKDSFEKTFKVTDNDRLMLRMYDSDLKINTWTNQDIKISGDIIIKGGSKEDVEKVLSAFKNPEVNQGGGTIEINTQFEENTVMIMGLYKKTKLSNGENVSVGSIKSNYTIWLPEKIAFNLISKYNTIRGGNLLGKLDFELYDVNVEIGDFGDKSTFDVKYSNVTLGKGNEARFNIYDSKFNTGEINKVIIETKYSNFNSKGITMLAADSYDDDFIIDNLGSIDMTAKYTSLKAKGTSNVGKFNLYDCNITAGNFGKIEFDSKYSEFTAGSVGALNITSSYEDRITLSDAKTISCTDGKYNEFNVGMLYTSVNLPSAYETKFRAEKTGPDFTGFNGDFKYGSVYLKLDATINYKLNFESRYGDISFRKEKFMEKTSFIKDNDNITFEGSTAANSKCEISFKAYDTNFTIE